MLHPFLFGSTWEHIPQKGGEMGESQGIFIQIFEFFITPFSPFTPQARSQPAARPCRTMLVQGHKDGTVCANLAWHSLNPVVFF